MITVLENLVILGDDCLQFLVLYFSFSTRFSTSLCIVLVDNNNCSKKKEINSSLTEIGMYIYLIPN